MINLPCTAATCLSPARPVTFADGEILPVAAVHACCASDYVPASDAEITCRAANL